MSLKIYSLLQKIIPELQSQQIPQDEDFDSFDEWINESVNIFHYIELKNYYDNGIEDNYYLSEHKVDVESLQNAIEADVIEAFDEVDDDVENDDFDLEDQMDALERVEEIIFDKIKNVASPFHLTLMIIYHENPYWLLVPTEDDDKLNQIVDAFNEAFNQDGDLNMAVY